MKKDFKNVTQCRICGSKKLYRFLDLGQMPIPNGFLPKEMLKIKEKEYELAVFLCEDCGLVQLTIVIDPNIMFKNYVYIPSTAKLMMNNFSNLAYMAYEKLKLGKKHLVVDIGSNDGSLLEFFKSFEAKVLGIDPSENITKVARMKGIPTETKLFNVTTAKYVVKKYGKADVITATNVIAHIDNLHQVFEGVSLMLNTDGLFITEFPYLLDLITKNQFDTIYHEHLSYFSLKPWRFLAEQYGFEIIDAKKLAIQGGSIRLVHRKKTKKKNPYNKTIDYLISIEERNGLFEKKAYNEFSERIMRLKKDLNKLLKDLKRKNKKIVGYGAAAKGNVLTNFFDIGTETLDYVIDSTPYKQGLYTPGKKIPVYPENRMLTDQPDYALILAWNFANEIIEKQKLYKKRGGKFIIPIPEVRIV
ncbi:MAG: class I SAM-dependent methyltransferase [Candidatus Daviesbacteria bacterium]|nr:class I SAM-dependent methyltransferase [Candidatus Daviesbacteria bacterium]